MIVCRSVVCVRVCVVGLCIARMGQFVVRPTHVVDSTTHLSVSSRVVLPYFSQTWHRKLV